MRASSYDDVTSTQIWIMEYVAGDGIKNFGRTSANCAILKRPKNASHMAANWQFALDLRFRTIAKAVIIAVGTAHNIFERFRATGEVAPKPPTKRDALRKLDCHHRLYVVGLIMVSPNLHLKELVDKVICMD